MLECNKFSQTQGSEGKEQKYQARAQLRDRVCVDTRGRGVGGLKILLTRFYYSTKTVIFPICIPDLVVAWNQDSVEIGIGVKAHPTFLLSKQKKMNLMMKNRKNSTLLYFTDSCNSLLSLHHLITDSLPLSCSLASPFNDTCTGVVLILIGIIRMSHSHSELHKQI